MSKYKIVASKSQKKYTIIVSADSETEAKEKLHKENYSILTVNEVHGESTIEWQKFLFQIEHSGDIKNGIIVWKDIFKVYVKLKDELGYNIIFLYPEGDEAHNSAEKKQQIMDQLKYWYELQQKSIKIKEERQSAEQGFYMKKKLDETYRLIEKVVRKIEYIRDNTEEFAINPETLSKLINVYENLIHIKSSTNLSKLREIGELALVKIAQIELQSVENRKDVESRKLLKNTNELLKKIGSKEQFIEHDKDIKRIFQDFFEPIRTMFSSSKNQKEGKSTTKDSKNLLDTESYGFLKTILLLEKYKEKLELNSREIRFNRMIFLNPFINSPFKEKTLLKRRVIQQNISILKAKKTGSIGSYTLLKKGYHKIIEYFWNYILFLKTILFIGIFLYVILFFFIITAELLQLHTFHFESTSLLLFLVLLFFYILLSFSRNFFLFTLNIAFFVFLFIFSRVNF